MSQGRNVVHQCNNCEKEAGCYTTNRQNMYTPRPKGCSIVFFNYSFQPYHDNFVAAETSDTLFVEIRTCNDSN